MSMYAINPDDLISFVVVFVLAIAFTLCPLPFNPQPLMVENNGVEPLTFPVKTGTL